MGSDKIEANPKLELADDSADTLTNKDKMKKNAEKRGDPGILAIRLTPLRAVR